MKKKMLLFLVCSDFGPKCLKKLTLGVFERAKNPLTWTVSEMSKMTISSPWQLLSAF
jgi:hypothetical protein